MWALIIITFIYHPMNDGKMFDKRTEKIIASSQKNCIYQRDAFINTVGGGISHMQGDTEIGCVRLKDIPAERRTIKYERLSWEQRGRL